MAKTLRQKSVNQILYISIGSAIAILILFIILFNVFKMNSKKQNVKFGDNNNYSNLTIEQANSKIGKSINEVSDETVAENLLLELNEDIDEEELGDLQSETSELSQKTITEENTTQISTSTSNNEITNNINENLKEEPESDLESEPVFIKPVDGEIVKQYGKEKLIYSNTLKEWTTHLGIDIKADKTTIVKSSSDGIVKSIKNDPRYGLTVIIEHNNGYESIYSNLLTAEFVTVGEKVKSGQTIGTVGNTATFEIVDEPHLHFEITKDGENIDPEMCLSVGR